MSTLRCSPTAIVVSSAFYQRKIRTEFGVVKLTTLAPRRIDLRAAAVAASPTVAFFLLAFCFG